MPLANGIHGKVLFVNNGNKETRAHTYQKNKSLPFLSPLSSYITNASGNFLN